QRQRNIRDSNNFAVTADPAEQEKKTVKDEQAQTKPEQEKAVIDQQEAERKALEGVIALEVMTIAPSMTADKWETRYDIAKAQQMVNSGAYSNDALRLMAAELAADGGESALALPGLRGVIGTGEAVKDTDCNHIHPDSTPINRGSRAYQKQHEAK